jgi:hypothetical protein
MQHPHNPYPMTGGTTPPKPEAMHVDSPGVIPGGNTQQFRRSSTPSVNSARGSIRSASNGAFASNQKWISFSERKHAMPTVCHPESCPHCDDFIDHVHESSEIRPIPDQIVLEHIKSLIERFGHLHRRLLASKEDPGAVADREAVPKLTLKERLEITPSNGEGIEPSSSKLIEKIKCLPEDIYSYWETSRHRTIPMPIIELPEDNPCQWIFNAEDKGFIVPAPIFYENGSRFQGVEDFFTIDHKGVRDLDDRDYDRYMQGCRNADSYMRTQLMDHYAEEYARDISKPGTTLLKFPCGLPEKWWFKIKLWAQNHGGIPFTVHCTDDGVVDYTSMATHFWVSEVSRGRDYHGINVLLVLFSNNARAARWIWDSYLTKMSRPAIRNQYTLPWPVRVPENIGVHSQFDSMQIRDLAGFLVFLVRDARFPLFNPDAMEAVSFWADDYLAGNVRNSFAAPVKDAKNRQEIVARANAGQPWMHYEDESDAE